MAEERAAAERAARNKRTRMLAGVVLGAIAVIAVAVVISTSGNGGKPAPKPGSSVSNAQVAAVNHLLNGIPQSGQTLGNPSAPVTITEYADLECPVCDAFALPTNKNSSDGSPGTGYFDQLVNQYVRTGKAKIVYRSLETATGNGPNASMWTQQQAAAYAAGLQNKAWNYIETFYYEQQPETSSYVNPAFLQGIAQQVPGLDVSKWGSDRQSQSLASQVASEGQTAVSQGYNSTPTVVIHGPKGQATPIVGIPSSYSALTSAINQVS
jgi:protein-disulfide isomerase